MTRGISDRIPRAALVTGGDLPAGAAIVAELTNAGFRVAVQCPPDQLPLSVAGAFVLHADLADERQVEPLLARALGAIGPVGVLVHAATREHPDAWDDATHATWNANFGVNLRVPFILARHFASALADTHEGVVINLLDDRRIAHALSFGLSQTALLRMTRDLALALAPRIRVNGIAANASPFEIGRAAMTILALGSMTGQMMLPVGVPPSTG